MTELIRGAAAVQLPRRQPPFHVWSLPGGTHWAEFYRDAVGNYVARFPSHADFHISADGRQVTGAPVPGEPEASLLFLYHNQVQPLMLSLQGEQVLHASAVHVDGRAVAFAGVSGSGKSTLAATFASAGYPFLTDDALVLRPGARGWDALAGPPSIRLWEDSEEAVVDARVALAPALAITPKARVLAGDRLPHQAHACPLGAIYFLQREEAADVRIRGASNADGLIEWVRHSFNISFLDRDALGLQLDRFATLAREVPAYFLDYPRSFDWLPRVRAALLTHNAASDSRGPP